MADSIELIPHPSVKTNAQSKPPNIPVTYGSFEEKEGGEDDCNDGTSHDQIDNKIVLSKKQLARVRNGTKLLLSKQQVSQHLFRCSCAIDVPFFVTYPRSKQT